MAAIARQIEVHKDEDGVVAVQNDTIVDTERGIVAEVEKVVAAVDVGDGRVAVMEQNRLKSVRAIPTQAQPQPDTPPSNPQPSPPPRQPPVTRPQRTPVTRPQQPPVTRSQQPTHRSIPMATVTDRTPLLKNRNAKKCQNCVELPGCLVCGSIFLVAGAALVGLAVTLLLPCGPLQHASIPTIIFGCLTIFVGCVCCAYIVRIKGTMAIFCFFFVGLLLGLMLTAAAFESSFIFDDYNLKRNGTYIDGCKFDEEKATPVALTVLSYVLLVLTCCFYFGTCINALTRNDPWLYKKHKSLC